MSPNASTSPVSAALAWAYLQVSLRRLASHSRYPGSALEIKLVLLITGRSAENKCPGQRWASGSKQRLHHGGLILPYWVSRKRGEGLTVMPGVQCPLVTDSELWAKLFAETPSLP